MKHGGQPALGPGHGCYCPLQLALGPRGCWLGPVRRSRHPHHEVAAKPHLHEVAVALVRSLNRGPELVCGFVDLPKRHLAPSPHPDVCQLGL